MIKHINSFSQINPIKPKTLVVLDIDETILRFQQINKEWWDDTYTRLLPYYKEKTFTHVELLWIKYISNNKPILLDKDNFYIFLENIKNENSELILLTARNESISFLTMKHLESCGLDINLSQVFYNKNKGEELQKIVTTIFPNIENILFVDDLEENLTNIQHVFNNDELSKYNLELYKIKHIL
jgi:hypothetical protein